MQDGHAAQFKTNATATTVALSLVTFAPFARESGP